MRVALVIFVLAGCAVSTAHAQDGAPASTRADDETSAATLSTEVGQVEAPTEQTESGPAAQLEHASPELASPTAPSSRARAPGEPPSLPPREIPDYDGRPEPGPSAEEILLWIPRVIFFPVHAVFEYLLRQPLGWLVTTLERENWPVILIDFFTWDERRAGIVPTAFYDFGFQPSVGLYFWWNDLGATGNHLRAQIGFGGVDWLRATVSDRIQVSRETELAFTADAWRRPDYVVQGFGWDSAKAQRSRYTRNYVDGRVELRLRPWRASEILFSTGVQWNDFELRGYAFDTDDPSLGTAVMQGWYERPPGLDGYTAYYQRLDIAIDTREERPAPGHGVRLEAFLHQGFDVTNILKRRWLRYGGAAGAFVDLGHNRVLALFGNVEFADPLGDAPVPLTEQVQLGGTPLVMSGFLRGALVGRSAAALTLEYRYPIWVFLDGSLHASVGNAFDEHLSDFNVDRLRMSFGFGFRSIGDRDQSFNVLVAVGTEPFAFGADVDSVRIVLGSQQGF